MSQSDFVSRGQALVAAGQFQEAVKVCRLGLLGRPTTVEGRVVLGQALLALKRFDEVLAEMRVALELDHSSIAAQVLRAEALLRKGDTAPAIEELHRARQLAPGDAKILQLLAEAEHGPVRPSVTHPAVGFVGHGDTKHYPGHPSGDESGFSESFTRPTSLQSPGGARRSSQRQAAMPEPYTPPPDVLAVGDRSGTVEVDPDLEGVELSGDLDFDDLAAPPRRGAGKPPAKKTPTMQLEPDLDDDVELAETISPERKIMKPVSRASEVRNAVNRPSGPIGESSEVVVQRNAPRSVPPPRSKNPSAPPPAPLPPMPSAPLAAALPTVTAAQPPSPYQTYQAPQPFQPTASPFAQTHQPFAVPPSPYQQMNAQRPTVALQPAPLNPAQQQSAAAVDQLFGNVDPRSVAAANEPTARPGELDPQILAIMSGQPQPQPEQIAPTPVGKMKTGVRRERARLRFLMWMLIGIAVIGGGVFAGFWIRAMRLEKQIVAARKTATDLAKADTWVGWIKARDSLSRIVQASGTPGNRAALVRARAFIAYEFGDGLPETKAQVEKLGGSSLDASLATAFVALSQSDAKAAKAAADTALAASANDPAALYAAGQTALLLGDAAVAVKYMKGAVEKENRPLYGIGLARAQAAAYNWDEAIAAVDKVLVAAPDQPSAVIARGNILAASGRIGPTSALGNEVHAQLERIIAEGKRPLGEQQHGISAWQLAMAELAIARVDFARGDANGARNAIYAAAQINLDDQRFAEEAIDALYFTGDFVHARSSADNAIKAYPISRRVRISLAQILLAQGRANDAIDLFAKQPELLASPHVLAIRGQAHLANGDPTSAATDFDAALKKLPGHEPSIVGRAWLELSMGDVEAASKRISERISPKGSSLALTTVYAAILRRSNDPAQREKAKDLLEKIVAGPNGLDAARAQLELARIYRDTGKFTEARNAFAEAAKTGNIEARLESALLMIEERAPTAGREAIDTLLREVGDRPSPQLVIEGARARMLDGNHTGAAQLLDLADKMSAVERWKLDRERGRLALRKSDFAGAATFLSRALDSCGGDAETFLLAADVATALRTGPIVEKVRRLAPERLKGMPEAHIVDGKLLILGEKVAEAEMAYRNAKEALRKENASARRLAQADFGLALVAYGRANMGEAQRVFEVVMAEDPSIVDVYVFLAEIVKDRKKASDYAQKATHLNPDYPYAWLLAGKFAARMGDKRMLADAIGRLQTIAPNGDELKELQSIH